MDSVSSTIESISTDLVTNSKSLTIRTKKTASTTKIKNTTNNYEDESFESDNTYSDTFESVTELTKSNKSTLSGTESSSYDSDESFMDSLNQNDLKNLKQCDYVKYIKIKLKLKERMRQQLKQDDKKFDKTQMEKLLCRAMNYGNKKETIIQNELACEVRPELINRLKTFNSIQQIKNQHLKKIEDFGQNVRLDFENNSNTKSQRALLPIEVITNDLYYKLKCDQVRRKISENHKRQHDVFYTDSIMMIAELARTLPKHSDPPEEIWNQLMKPLNEQLNK